MIAILAITGLGLLGDAVGSVMSAPPSIAPTFLEMNIADVFQVGMVSLCLLLICRPV